MTALTEPILDRPTSLRATAPDTLVRRLFGSMRVVIGGGLLLLIIFACIATLPLTRAENVTGPNKTVQKNDFYYDQQHSTLAREHPGVFTDKNHSQLSAPHSQTKYVWLWLGTDALGRSMFSRCLLGGTISLTIGIAAAAISVFLGVAIGLIAGYRGGWVDALLMRSVDILYGLPYILIIILLKIALEPALVRISSPATGNLVVLFLAIGLVSWLTMARVIRGQVLSLRAQPFIESCRASGLTEWRVFTRHLLPNLIGPITVYATLTVPQAILEESFLSFLGIGIQAPVPTWGSLASDGLMPALNPIHHYWYMLVIPCLLLIITLLSLNFLGDGLRDVFDPKREAAKA